MASVPQKLPTRDVIVEKDYSYSELINNDIDLNQINAITFCIDDLSCNMDRLLELLNKSSDFQLKFKDFESVIFIDNILNNKINNKVFLIDDGYRMDRSYIDLTKITNLNLTIPLNYLMWGVKFNESINVYCFSMYNNQGKYLNPTSVNGNTKISYEDYLKINNKIDELIKINPDNAREKIALVSDYIQSSIQYIDGYESVSSNGTFITPDFPPFYIKSGLIETVLNEHNGICMGISNLSTVLLNNEQMDMEVESVYGCSHVWNKVLIDGKYYYFDNTWSITRNENISNEGLIALSFTKKYLLFGKDTAINIGHHIPETAFIYNGVISEDDIKSLNYEQQFEYNDKPIYKSIKK